jgi:uncharacterized membrane protein YtjA (UPF0391 family)
VLLAGVRLGSAQRLYRYIGTTPAWHARSRGNFFQVSPVITTVVVVPSQHAALAIKLQIEGPDRLRLSKLDGHTDRRQDMLYYALVFLLIAILAGFLGFGGVAILSAGIAKILFFVFIVLFLVSLITHVSRRV